MKFSSNFKSKPSATGPGPFGNQQPNYISKPCQRRWVSYFTSSSLANTHHSRHHFKPPSAQDPEYVRTQDLTPSPYLQLLLSSRLDVCITKKKQQDYLFNPLVTQTAGWKDRSQKEREIGVLQRRKKTPNQTKKPTLTLSNLSCKSSQAISCLVQIKREVSLLLSHKAHLTFSEKHFAATDLFKAHWLFKLIKARLCLME